MSTIKVIVVIGTEDLDGFAAVVQACKQAGLCVEREMPLTGALAGTIECDRLPDLERVPGVVAVEPDRAIQIAPPERELQ